MPWDDDSCHDFKGCSELAYTAHGYVENRITSRYIRDLVLKLSKRSCAVGVNWEKGNKMYVQAMQNIRSVGAAMGYHVAQCSKKIPGLKIKFTGFSLGAQIVGEASWRFQKFTGKKADECIALGPAGPYYDGCDENIRVSANSCSLVQVVHSDPIRSETSYKSGKCDYWLNYGPCSLSGAIKKGLNSLINLDWNSIRSPNLCSHIRATHIFISQLRNNCFKEVPYTNCFR